MPYKDKRKQREWYLNNKERVKKKSTERYNKLKQTAKGKKKLNEQHKKAQEKFIESGKSREYNKKRWKKLKQNEKEYKKLREKSRIWERGYRKNPIVKEKRQLRNKAYNNLRNKIIQEKKCCQKCQTTENLQIHHEDYNSNELKNLMLLCRKCHQKYHTKIKNSSLVQKSRRLK